MSKLTIFLDRHVSYWRDPSSLGTSIARMVHWIQFAGLVRTLRSLQTMALVAPGFDAYCARANIAPATSAEALLSAPAGTPRVWWVPTPESAARNSRIVKIDGVQTPKFGIANPTHPAQQGFLRIPSGIVFPRTGIVMPEPGSALRNDIPIWVADHRLTPGFVDFVGDALIARERALYPWRRIRRPVINLCHAYHRNYGHWMIDLLPFLLPWRAWLHQGRLSVLVPPMTAAWQRRTLELLGIPASALIEATEVSVLCDDIIVPGLRSAPGTTPIQTSDACLPPASDVIETIKILRREAQHAMGVDQPERIYVSRRGVESFRSMTREEDVEVAMRRLGFAVIQPQELTFDEQVTYFARARVIVGPHGAGLNNSVFAPTGCLVVDILPDVWTPIWVLRLTQLFEHHYLPVAYAADPALSKPILLGNAVIDHSRVYSVPADAFATMVAGVMQRMDI